MIGVQVIGDFAQAVRDETQALARLHADAIRDEALLAQARLRQQAFAGGLGAKIANAWRQQQFPKSGPSLGAAALVWSKAPLIVDAFNRGTPIRSRAGFFLAVPLPAAGRGIGGKKITPGEFERRTGTRLRFVYRRGRPSLLVAENARLTARGAFRLNETRRRDGTRATRTANRTSIPVFVLLPQVNPRKRFDVAGVARAADSALAARFRSIHRDPFIG